MSWLRKLPTPLYLNDGRTIGTLGDGRDLIISLPEPRQNETDWKQAGQMLLDAAYRNRRAPIRDVAAQLSRALKADGLI